jgi:parvulin-like peptidyl-prolyl isomerase
LAKKRKKAISERTPTKRQLSKWERQMKIRRIIIIASIVFLVGIGSWVGYEYYSDNIKPWREVMIEVNDARFNMGYYVEMLDAYTQNMEDMEVYYLAGMVADNLIDDELMRQGAGELGVNVTRAEIDERLKLWQLESSEVYRNIVESVLLQEKIQAKFTAELPATMEQAHVQVMLVESEAEAEEVISAVQAGGNFTILVNEFSRYSTVQGDLGWLPADLMPNAYVKDAAFGANITPGQISQPIHDESISKNIGYWLIEVLDVDDEAAETRIDARVMLLGSKEEAERVRAELMAGGNFTALAKEYSQHQSKEFGGALGWKKRGDMGSTAFDQVAFTLAPGEMSEPVRDVSASTTGGYWLVQVMDRGEREIEEQAKQLLVQKRLQDWLADQREQSRIVDRLDEAKLMLAVDEVLSRR